MHPDAKTPDEDVVLKRVIGSERVCGFSNPAHQTAALSLARRGLVEAWEGAGRDHGLMLVRRSAGRR